MGRTLTEKILADRAEIEEIQPGQFILIKPDAILVTDESAPDAIESFKRIGARTVIKPDRVVFVHDHLVPARDAQAAETAALMRKFAEEQGIANYFEVGRSGVGHLLMLEEGLAVPGDVVIGADEHTCAQGALGLFAAGFGSQDIAAAWAIGETWMKVPETVKVELSGELPQWVGGKDLALKLAGDLGPDAARYKAIEFCGSAIERLPVHHRVALCAMAVEAGAKNAIIQADDVAASWVRPRARRTLRLFKADHDARYEETRRYDLGGFAPQVALAGRPIQVKPVDALDKVRIDQVVLGSCSNGMIEDLREAAAIMRGNKVNRQVRMLVIPGTSGTLKQAIEEGLIQTFVGAGALVLPPGCGPCNRGQGGALAAGEVAVTTAPFSLAGCMGDPAGQVYLAGPAVAAVSALMGFVADPRSVSI
ncbi:MAG: aconitase/3-isopropylmalate dehydratase large subunit family protein [Acidobacteriota bacterium]